MDLCVVYARKSKFFCYMAAVISNDGSTGRFIQATIILNEVAMSIEVALMSLDVRIVRESSGAQR
jgi:hypothetical protein